MRKVALVLFSCLLLPIANSGVANVVEDGLVAFYAFDEGSGKTANDVTGNGHSGTFEGAPKWVDGKFNSALEFDGEDDYVVVKDNDALDFTNKVTMMAWFSPNDDLTQRRLMVKNDSIFVIFDFGDTKSIDFLTKPTNEFAESTTNNWTIGEWYHFAGTFDGKTLKVYVNGKLEGEKPNPVDILPSDKDLWIGGDDYGRPTDLFPGKIDEVRIYDKVLTESEILRVMDTPQDVDPKGKLATTWSILKQK